MKRRREDENYSSDSEEEGPEEDEERDEDDGGEEEEEVPKRGSKKYKPWFPAKRIKKIMQENDEVGKVASAVPMMVCKSFHFKDSRPTNFIGSLFIHKHTFLFAYLNHFKRF